MRKLRSDALWHKLTPDQQATIQRWFLDDHLSYDAVHARMRAELGITCARSILGRMYHYCRNLRFNERETIREKLAEAITEPGVNLGHIRADTLTVVTGRLLQCAVLDNDTKQIAALGRVMFQGEDHEIERERMKLEQERLALARQQVMISAEWPGLEAKQNNTSRDQK